MPRRLDQYQIVEKLPDEAVGVHQVYIRTKKTSVDTEPKTAKHNYHWYSKKIEVEDVNRVFNTQNVNIAFYKAQMRLKNRNMAKREVFAQELFRLLLNKQPKTRYVADRNHESYVFSKEVVGFITFANYPTGIAGLRDDILDGKVKGLGRALVASLWINETDLHFGNIGVAGDEVVKLDGDLAFGNLNSFLENKLSDRTKPLEAVDLNLLPYTYHYGAWNWLDLRVHSKINSIPPVLVCDKLRKSELFQQEVHEELLRILLLSDDIIKLITGFYIIDPLEQDVLKNALITRRVELLQAALGKKNFVSYLKTEKCQQDFIKYKKYLEGFKISGMQELWSPSLAVKLEISFNFLLLSAEKQAQVAEKALSQQSSQLVLTRQLGVADRLPPLLPHQVSKRVPGLPKP